MENNDNLKNIAMLKKCNKIYDTMFWVYFWSSIPMAVIRLVYGIIENIALTDGKPFIHAGAVISILLYFACGLMYIHEKENKYLVFLIPITFITSFFSPLHILVTIISVLFLPATHKKYHWLEQQEGFPYFNERFEEKKNSLYEYENNNPYQKVLDRYKESSGKMDEI